MHIVILDEQDSQTGFFQYTKDHITHIKKYVPDAVVTIIKASDDTRDAVLARADVLMLHSTQYLQLDKLPKLKWIHATFAGVDNLAALLRGTHIILTNSSGVHPIPIAEHVLGFMLMFSRSFYRTYRVQIQEGKWVQNMHDNPIVELQGRAIGIVGYGHIGERVAMLSKAFGMRVLGYATTRKESNYLDKSYIEGELDALLKESDFVVNCLPLTKKTHGLYSITVFQMMKQTAYFINIGRGPSVVEKDLITALEKKYIAGAGLDVFEHEPLTPENPLWKFENVIITPHIAGWTPKYIDRMIGIFCENLNAYQSNGSMPTRVDIATGY